jgi:hypothetical protein
VLPSAQKTEHLHDGFYLRFGAGPIYGRTRVRTDRVSQPNVELTAFGMSLEVWAGAAAASGITIGGLVGWSRVSSGEASLDLDGPIRGQASTTLLGAFLDAYPEPEQGYHFGGLVALAGTLLKTEPMGELAGTRFLGGGIALGVFGGLDAWIAKQWSLGFGLHLRGSLARDQSTVNGSELTKLGTTYAAHLLIDALYH